LVESFFLLELVPTAEDSFIGQPVPLLQEETNSRTIRRELHNKSSFNFFMKKLFWENSI